MNRAYGHDETDEFEALAEAERRPDGLIQFRTVLIDKREDAPKEVNTPA